MMPLDVHTTKKIDDVLNHTVYQTACEMLFVELQDQFLAWLGKQDPEDVFDDNALASWAARHGYYSREP